MRKLAIKFGLDFGTTNSSIAIEQDGVGKVLDIDNVAVDPRVIRSMLYFYPRKFVADPKTPLNRVRANIFYADEVSYEGEFKALIGQGAITKYMEDNKHRTAGIIRTIMTGRYLDTGSASSDQVKGNPVAEKYEEMDYGTGRLIQALKTGLKSPYFKGTTVFGKFFPLEELIGIFVGKIKKQAEQSLGVEIDEVLCGRPVHFLNDPGRDLATQNRLKEALKQAGFKQVRFEFEPVAAAKQFIAASQGDENLVFCFDFGGGTLDTAIVQAGEEPKVLAADGVYIGGDLLNADIMQSKLWSYFGSENTYTERAIKVPNHLYEMLDTWYGIPNLNNSNTMELLQRFKYKNSDPEMIDRLIYLIKANLGFDLYEAIERAKKELSFFESSRIVFRDGIIDIDVRITRVEFEQIIEKRVEEIKQTVLRTLRTAGVEASQIDVVVRTGGSSLIPVFEELLAEIFSKEKIKQFETFTSIAGGLALGA